MFKQNSSNKKEKLSNIVISLALYTLSFLVISYAFFPSKSIKDSNSPADRIYQISTINALLAGSYDGELEFAALKNQGDFGHGTIDKLDGELVFLDGIAYQVKADGSVHILKDQSKTPYANVVFFAKDKTLNLDSLISFVDLQKSLDSIINSKNYPYAIKITGKFKNIKLRSVAAQEKPYKDLLEVTKGQSIFDYTDLDGTLVGFWMPNYVKGINIPGYHFHFISTDKTKGGHVLDIGEMSNLVIELDQKTGLELDLPKSYNSNNIDLSIDRTVALNTVETNKR